MRISQYDRLVRLSPYLVNINSTPLNYGYTGMFTHKKAEYHPHIDISNQITLQSEKTATLLHEIGHAIHYRRHCKCYQTDDRVLKEYHAQKFALRFMLRYKLTGALRWDIQNWEYNAHTYSEVYQKAFAQLQQDKIWHKCKNYLTRPTG